MTAEAHSSSLRRFAGPLAVVAVIVLLVTAVLLSRRSVLAAPEQPIEFSHRAHSEAEITCLFCHPNPMRSDIAGIPSLELCMGCHEVIAPDNPEVMKLAGYWERKEPILWQPVSPSLDFVYFSHQPHISGAVSCETCHGDVASMTVAQPVGDMDMGWCLDCHLEQPTEKVARLADCMACHK